MGILAFPLKGFEFEMDGTLGQELPKNRDIWRLSCRDVDFNPDLTSFPRHALFWQSRILIRKPSELFFQGLVRLTPSHSTGSHPSNYLLFFLTSSCQKRKLGDLAPPQRCRDVWRLGVIPIKESSTWKVGTMIKFLLLFFLESKWICVARCTFQTGTFGTGPP